MLSLLEGAAIFVVRVNLPFGNFSDGSIRYGIAL